MRLMPVFALLLMLQISPLTLAQSGGGRFVVGPSTVESSAMRAEARRMQATGTLQAVADALNSILILPREVSLRYAECGEANAYYDSSTHEILMCLELMAGMAETLDGQFEEESTEQDALGGAYIAVVLHEVGHALVHVLEIPITGREEDAVDQLSAWMLIKAGDAEAVLGAAASYYTDLEELDHADYAGLHSLDAQRYFNLVCWAYGSDPDNSQELIDSWELPEDRAEGCAEEYALLDRSWSRLLGAHLRSQDVTALAIPRATQAPAGGRGDDFASEFVDDAPTDEDSPRVVGRGAVNNIEDGEPGFTPRDEATEPGSVGRIEKVEKLQKLERVD
jgi:hypothetical protein